MPEKSMPEDTHRPIRSFVRREGRLTSGQQCALDTLWSRYGIDSAGPDILEPERIARNEPVLLLDDCFQRKPDANRQTVLEIGFGNGGSLAEMAAALPDHDYLGIEVHRPGVGNLLRLLEAHGLNNVRILCDDAVQILKHRLPDACLDRVQLFFPDPWHKRRHHKRRIVNPEFVALVATKLRPGGVFHLATDWQHYAQQMMDVLEAAPDYQNCAAMGEFSPRPGWRPLTKFEHRGQCRGHGVWDLLFKRI